MQAEANVYRGNTLGLTRLWAHECHRTYLDRLITPEDEAKYMEFMTNACKEFSDFKTEAIFAEPLIFTNFVSLSKGHESAYLNVKDMDDLKAVLE